MRYSKEVSFFHHCNQRKGVGESGCDAIVCALWHSDSKVGEICGVFVTAMMLE